MKKKLKGGNDTELDQIEKDVRLMEINRERQDIMQNKIINNDISESILSRFKSNYDRSTNGCLNNDDNVDYLYLQSIRGGDKKNMTSYNNTRGGCLTCPEGQRKMLKYTKTLIVVLPKLYKKYKTNSEKDFSMVVKKLADKSKKTQTKRITTKTKKPAAKKPASKKPKKPVVKKPKKVSSKKSVQKTDKKRVKRVKRVRGGSDITNYMTLSSDFYRDNTYTPTNLNCGIAPLTSSL